METLLIAIVILVVAYFLIDKPSVNEIDDLHMSFVSTIMSMGYVDEAHNRAYNFASEEGRLLLRRRIRQLWNEWGLEKKIGTLMQLIEDEAVEYYELGVKKHQSHLYYRGEWEQPSLLASHEEFFEKGRLDIMEKTGLIRVEYGKSTYIGGPGAGFARSRRIIQIGGNQRDKIE